MGEHRTKIGLFTLADHLPDPLTGTRVPVAQRLSEIIEQGALAEAAGFERFGVGEHHFSDYIVPNPSLMLAAVAARTTRIRLFTSVTLIACRDAVQLAEDIAVLDNISSGRLELCFARGVSQEAAAVFGVERSDVHRVMADKLTSLRALLAGGALAPESHDHPALRLVPRPLQTPGPPLWIGGGVSPESCELAIKSELGLFLPSLLRLPEEYRQTVERYRSGMAERGAAGRARIGLPSLCWVARTSQAARAAFLPRLGAYADYAERLRGGYIEQRNPEVLLNGPAICGSPAEVSDRIAALNDLLGIDYHILAMDTGGMPMSEMRAAIELMATDVLPAFGRS